MSLIADLEAIKSAINQMQDKAQTQQHIYFRVIDGIVQIHQKHRLAKNYGVSDELRDLLQSVDVRIIQGTAQYGGNIPEGMRSRTVDDTWVLDHD